MRTRTVWRVLMSPGALALLLLVALGLRLFGLNWDGGHLFHPDERAILWCVNDLGRDPSYYTTRRFCGTADAPWNPQWFPYGSLPLYLLKVIQVALSPWKDLGMADLRIPGRVLTGLADTLIVLGVFLLGRRLFGMREGVLGAFLATFAVIHIQLAHFFTADTFLALFSLYAMLSLIPVAQRGSLLWAGVSGVWVGFALASKFAGAPLLLPLTVAPLLYLLGGVGERVGLSRPDGRRWKWALGALALGYGMVGVSTFVAQPYAFLDWPKYLADVLEQSEMARRIRDYPYTLQYVGTPAYWYPVEQLARWGLGLPVGVVAWMGLLAAPFWAWRSRRRAEVLVMGWVIPYFLIVGGLPVKYLRYLLPIVPFLLVYGARLLVVLVEWVRQIRLPPMPQRIVGVAVWGVVAGALLGGVLYGVAYVSMYRKPHPAILASHWLGGHARPGSLILKEHWEEGLPNLWGFRVEELPLYEPDSWDKADRLAQRLAQADYLVFYSQRLYGTIPRLPHRYPMSSHYYRLLFAGELGYRLVHWEGRWPSLPGLAIMDDTFRRAGVPVPEPLRTWKPAPLPLRLGFADESFSVYDHPLVLIFQRVEGVSAEALRERLWEGLTLTPSPPVRSTPMLTPREWADQQRGGTWARLFPKGDILGRQPVLGWLVVLYGVSGAGVLWGFWAFRSLPDGGWLLGRTLGLLATAYLAWLCASLKLVPFGRGSIAVFLVLLLVGGGLLAWWGRKEWGKFLRERWRLLAVEEALFLSAFGAFVLIRMANPDLWHPFRGGEKPMDLAHLNAVVKSTWFPPYDPWFAGGALNYYYFGQVLVATLVHLTAIPTPTAYNLAVPTLFALATGSAFSIAYTLGGGKGGVEKGAIGVGIAGASFAFVLGNLDGAVQLLQGVGATLSGRSFPPFDYWRSSRMMPPDPPGFEITEFPFFTFLFADLHAHLLAIPLSLLVLGGVLGLVRAVPEQGLKPILPILALLGLAVGSLYPTNSWDFPTFGAITLASGVLGGLVWWRAIHGRAAGGTAQAVPTPNGIDGWVVPSRTLEPGAKVLGTRRTVGLRAGHPWAFAVGGGVVGCGVVLAGILLFLPFHVRFAPPVAGVQPTVAKTMLIHYLAIHGLFLFPLVTWLVWEGVPVLGRVVRGSVWGVGAVGLGGGILLALVAGGYATVAMLLGLGVLGVVVGWKAWERGNREALIAVLMAEVAFALGIGVDFLRLRDDIDRMNTVFKFYIHGWVLLALASAYGLGQVLPRLVRRAGAPPPEPTLPNLAGCPPGAGGWPLRHQTLRPRLTGWGMVWLGVFALLLLSAGIYPLLGTRARLADRFTILPFTLDGTAYMEWAVYRDERGQVALRWDREAIRWLWEYVEGTPVIAEANTPLYRWGGRISVYTGLPSVVGWSWHQMQQRCGGPHCPPVEERLTDLQRLYTTVDIKEAHDILRRYGVGYVYVGETEALYYPPQGLAKFAEMERQGLLQGVYRNEKVTIYRVLTWP
ncbi:MAG: DUF2298 domain-containing protein [Chloroflexota bacterium]|nr:DUF2298 domain-containing protein [Chloroflexota bacterium]